MLSEMTERELRERIARVQLQSEIAGVQRRAELKYPSAKRMVFRKYQKDS